MTTGSIKIIIVYLCTAQSPFSFYLYIWLWSPEGYPESSWYADRHWNLYCSSIDLIAQLLPYGFHIGGQSKSTIQNHLIKSLQHRVVKHISLHSPIAVPDKDEDEPEPPKPFEWTEDWVASLQTGPQQSRVHRNFTLINLIREHTICPPALSTFSFMLSFQFVLL